MLSVRNPPRSAEAFFVNNYADYLRATTGFCVAEAVTAKPQSLASIEGEAVLFNVYSGIKPAWGDQRFDCRLIIRPGAFSKCLESGRNIPLTVAHKGSDIATTRDGSLSLLETSRGLSIRARPLNTEVGRSAVANVRSGKLTAMSFSHDVTRAKVEWTQFKGLPCAVLHEAELLDVCICKEGAFDGPSCWIQRRI